ncbi:MAG: RnfABCDGE type electron transport complex subunit G [Deltaproteobacteria bacterium]|nr:RnfABCDGE type electron transport complex subunit G [Deltaproteobacteria bacterium]
MPESVKMIFMMTLFSGLAGLGLAAMDNVTKPLAEQNNRLFTLKSIKLVMPKTDTPDPCKKYDPGFDNQPDNDAVCINGTTVYRGREGDKVTDIAVISIGDNAFSGTIKVLVGLRVEDEMLMGLKVLQHAETPGLGTNMTKCTFQQQMVGHTPTDINFTVKKDGGDIDQLSGATITSRSMLNAITKAQNLLKEHKDEILNGSPLKEGESCNGK